MTRLFITLCLLAFSNLSEAQLWNRQETAIRIGYGTYRSSSVELEGVVTTLSSNMHDGQALFDLFMHGYAHAGAEIYFPKGAAGIAPKFGVGGTYWLLGGDVSLTMFNNGFDRFYPILTPEIGVSILGMFYITYGYQINLQNQSEFEIHPHRLSLRLHLFTSFFKN